MHNFRVKISRYSKIIYCLQEKTTHFGLDVSLIYVMSSLYELDCFKYFIIYILEQISYNKNYFELYQVLMYNFLCSNDKIFTKVFELYQIFVCQNVSIS